MTCPAAMSGWYQNYTISNAIDAYDALGVLPGPDSAHTPLQRIVALSLVPNSIIKECYEHTMESIGQTSPEAHLVDSAYASLQGDARGLYDMKLVKAASEARCVPYIENLNINIYIYILSATLKVFVAMDLSFDWEQNPLGVL